MVFINSTAPAGISGGPTVNVLPQGLIEAQNAASASPTAQQLLPIAVVASAVIPAYLDTPKTPKPVIRSGIDQPSSALAAQLIAQSPDISDDELALFAPRTTSQQSPVQNNQNPQTPSLQLVVDKAAAEDVPQQAVAQAEATVAQAVRTQSAPGIAAPVTTALALFESGTPAVKPFVTQQAIGGKKANLVLTRGSSAYALTAARNETMLLAAAADPSTGINNVA